MIVTNATGRSFEVHVVAQGDRYGLHDSLVHRDRDPLVEFYDRTYAGQKGYGARGQFVSNYYASTLAKDVGQAVGLSLAGGFPEWYVDAAAMAEVHALAARVTHPDGPDYTEPAHA